MAINLPLWAKTAPARHRSSSTPIQACAVLALCTGLAGARASVAASPLVVSDPWMRAIAAPVPAAAYFILQNASDTPRTLVSLSSPDCGAVMMHQSRNVNGVDSMVMVAQRIVPPHGRVAFAPGGYHLMCMSPSKSVKPGARIAITLRFADGERLLVRFPVRAPGG